MSLLKVATREAAGHDAHRFTCAIVALLVLFPDLVFSNAALLAQDPVQAQLVRTALTSDFVPPNSDPAGIVYLRDSGRLLITDSEINEIDDLFTGDNLFEASLQGQLNQTATTLPFSREPTGATINPLNGHLFFSDDDAREIVEVNPGDDGIFGTPDDRLSSFDTLIFGSGDPEGLTFDTTAGHLFVVDGVADDVFEVDPGPNGYFDGVAARGGDDLVTSFDVGVLGVVDPEGITFNASRGTLLIVASTRNGLVYETTTDGVLLGRMDISAASPEVPADLTLAPGSVDAGVLNLYVVDRDRDEVNDGKLYELSLPPTALPSITSFVPDRGPALSEVTLGGSNLNDTSNVSFGSVPATFSIISDTELRVTVPADATSGPIRVTNGAGAVLGPGTFFVLAPAEITALVPAAGGEGTEVRVLGSGLIGVSAVSFNGVPSSDFTLDSEGQVRAVVPPGATSGPVELTTPLGSTTSPLDFTVLPTLRFTPTDDAHVRSNQSNNNFGDDVTLRVKAGTSVFHAYLKFNLSGIEPVQSVRLRLFTTQASPDGGSVFEVSNNFAGSGNPWDEENLTWSNAPALVAPPVAEAGSVFLDTWLELELSEVITADGIYSFGFSSADPLGTLYSSKEGTHPPELVVTLTTPVDTDGDMILDPDDNCAAIPNADQADFDGDEFGDICDNCPLLSNSQSDMDGDEFGDVCDNCPALDNPGQIDADGNEFGAACDCDDDNAAVQENCTGPVAFVRADANGDGSVNIADPTFVANFLFGIAPATPPPCDRAADANADGTVNIADPTFIANFLFGISPASPPPAPHPDCGTDEEAALSCASFPGCDA